MSDVEINAFREEDSGVCVPISRHAREQAAPMTRPSQGHPSDRRTFLKAVAASSVALPLLGGVPGGAAPGSTARAESNREIPSERMLAPDRGSLGVAVDADEGHEAILAAMVGGGSDCLFFCGGTDNFPFMEGVAKAKALDRAAPRLITCLHEYVAMSAAHGHFMVSGRPQVVMVHVDLGTQNVGGALHNAWVGNAGVLLMAGRTPWTVDGSLPGSRDRSIQFIQERYDQAEIVRPYTKWDYEFRTEKDIGRVMARAYQVATSEPYGPVYMSVPREIMMAPIQGATLYKADRFAPAVSPQGDRDALREAARLLVEARRPVVLVSRMGRHPEAVPALVSLAEKLSLPVISDDKYLNLPSTHPLGVTSPQSYIERADVVLQIDHMVPYVPLLNRPPADCRIISMDIDPVRLAQPLWGFPVDIPITCDSSKAIPLLSELADDFIGKAEMKKFRDRRKTMEAEYAAFRRFRDEAVAAAGSRVPISTAWLGHCIREIVDEDTIQLTEAARGVTPAEKAQPGHYFRLPASSLGWAGGAALGAKLAAPEKTVIVAQGDGSFIFTDPTAVFWTARQYGLPFLTVVVNNKQYLAVASGIPAFYPKGYVVRSGDWSGSSIDPPPDYKLISQACGGYGETVTDPGELPPALRRGLEAVRDGRCAVIDVHVTA